MNQIPILGPILNVLFFIWLGCGAFAVVIFLVVDTLNNRAHRNVRGGLSHTLVRAPLVFLIGPIYLYTVVKVFLLDRGKGG